MKRMERKTGSPASRRRKAPLLIAALCLAALALGAFHLSAHLSPDARENETDATSTGDRVVFERTISPNEDSAASEKDLVYDTVRITQDDTGTATVTAESNFAMFEPISYQVDCKRNMSADDVSVQWTTLMGNTEPSEEDELCIAVVSVKTVDGGVDERKINFVNGALEKIGQAIGMS